MRRSGRPEKNKESKVPHGKPKQESRLEPAEEQNNQLSRTKNRERVQLNKNDMVGKYKVIDMVAPDSGTNEIYVVQHKETLDVNCMKIETRAEKFPMLNTELFILLEIRKKADVNHFCKVYDRGQEERFNYVVLTRTGPSLRNLRRGMPNTKLSLGCGLSVGKQCLQALEELHRIGFVHRNIDPSNFCCGRREINEERKIYFVGFSVCHQFRDSTTGAPKRPRLKPTRYMGSSRHAPRAAYLGMELSRADDLESWFYMVVELIKGGLPWMTLQDPAEIYKYQRKCRTGLDKQKMFGGLPKQMETMMYLIDRISYYGDPDYSAIHTLIDEAMIKNNVQEHPYDWELKQEKPEEPAEAAAAVVLYEVIAVKDERGIDLRSKPFGKGKVSRVSCRCSAERFVYETRFHASKTNILFWHSHGGYIDGKYYLYHKGGCKEEKNCCKDTKKEYVQNGFYRLKNIVKQLKGKGVTIVLVLLSCQRNAKITGRELQLYSNQASDPQRYGTEKFSLIRIVSRGKVYMPKSKCPRKKAILKNLAKYRNLTEALKALNLLEVDEKENPIIVDFQIAIILLVNKGNVVEEVTDEEWQMYSELTDSIIIDEDSMHGNLVEEADILHYEKQGSYLRPC